MSAIFAVNWAIVCDYSVWPKILFFSKQLVPRFFQTGFSRNHWPSKEEVTLLLCQSLFSVFTLIKPLPSWQLWGTVLGASYWLVIGTTDLVLLYINNCVGVNPHSREVFLYSNNEAYGSWPLSLAFTSIFFAIDTPFSANPFDLTDSLSPFLYGNIRSIELSILPCRGSGTLPH